jgi:hypothetical protein
LSAPPAVLQVSTTSTTPVSSNPLSPSSASKTDWEKLHERAKRFGLPEPVQPAKKLKVADTKGIKSPSSPHMSNANSNVGLKIESAVIRFFIYGRMYSKNDRNVLE